jgi:hypothetical protein
MMMEVKKPFMCRYQPLVPCRYLLEYPPDQTITCSECELYDPKRWYKNPWFKNLFKSRKEKDLEELNSYLALYVQLLAEENRGLSSFAWTHGWRGTEETIKAGALYRKKITELTQKIYNP